MIEPSTFIIAIISAVFGSTGFWALVTRAMNKKTESSKMLKGLGHDRILYLGESYIKRGYITLDEYENLHDYLYLPYRELGGNGTAEKLMNEIKKLPIRDNKEGK